MFSRIILLTMACALAVPSLCAQSLVREVRAAIAKKDFGQGEAILERHREARGVTAEMLEAQSWLGRGALAEKQFDRAESYAVKTHEQALELLKSRGLDADNNLPIALGAAIEVQAQVLGARGERSAAVALLQRELKTYWDTSIRTRIQKNINLLTLEGRSAPPLDVSEWLGPRPAPLSQSKGRATLLFFWAHWCPDCKSQAPILARLAAEFGPKGLVIIGPTQPYGYIARGKDAAREEELKYIDEVRQKAYGQIAGMSVPLSEENFRTYGASTTPTLVLVGRQGVVTLYHPGQMCYEELARLIAAELARAPAEVS